MYAGPAQAAEFDPTTTEELIAAIDASNANAEADVINLVADQTYTLDEVSDDDPDFGASGLPPITSGITINGNGATIERSSVTDTPAFRIFFVDGRTPETADLTITNLTVSGGAGDEGGGILNIGGVLVVEESNITGNLAESDGGGIGSARFAEFDDETGDTVEVSRGETTIVDSDISENTAGGDGGGIRTNNAVTIEGSTVSSNTTEDSGGGIDTDVLSSVLTIEESTISDNEATDGDGGGIDIDGKATITETTVSGNSSGDDGGALWASGLTTVQNSTISGNSSADEGGGIFSTTDGYVEGKTPPDDERTTITNSTIFGNSSVDGGSGIYNNNGYTEINYTTITNNTITQNTATDPDEAFGVQSDSDDLTGTRLTGTIVVGNTQEGQLRDVGNDAPGANFPNDRPYESGGYNVIGQAQTDNPDIAGDQNREQDFDQDGDTTSQTVTQAFGTDSPTLAENGGSTQTVALEPGSVAINNVPTGTEGTPQTDQRDVDRPQGNDSDTGSFEFEGPDITITPDTLPDANEGQTYSQQLSASGSSGSYTFSITQGQLPNGLTLSNNGLISGTPEDEPGEYTFTVEAEDTQGFTGSREYTLTVIAANEAPTISKIEDITIRQDTTTGPIRFTVTDPDDPAETIEVRAQSSNTSLVRQSGIEISGTAENRTVRVTPVSGRSGTAEITLTVEDPEGLADSETFVVRVTPTPEADDRCTIVGTPGNDILRGTAGRDVLCGTGGNDIINGLGGNDVLRGGAGNDVIRGGAGSDVIEGGAGNDRLHGERGNDQIFGNAGNDVLDGGPGTDRLDGGSGKNVVRQ